MPTALTLLDGVTWLGRPVDRVSALLAALATRPEGLTAADGQVDGVDGALVAERLDETVGVDGKRGVLGGCLVADPRGGGGG